MQNAKPRYKYKVSARVLEYSKDKDPSVDEPDRVVERGSKYLSEETMRKEKNHGFNR